VSEQPPKVLRSGIVHARAERHDPTPQDLLVRELDGGGREWYHPAKLQWLPLPRSWVRLTRWLVAGDRTVTAERATGKCACKECGRTEPRKELWGVTAAGITTAVLAEVDHWICSACFTGKEGRVR
jgi:hypothetical protein